MRSNTTARAVAAADLTVLTEQLGMALPVREPMISTAAHVLQCGKGARPAAKGIHEVDGRPSWYVAQCSCQRDKIVTKVGE
jgi:hypothetical protein